MVSRASRIGALGSRVVGAGIRVQDLGFPCGSCVVEHSELSLFAHFTEGPKILTLWDQAHKVNNLIHFYRIQ